MKTILIVAWNFVKSLVNVLYETQISFSTFIFVMNTVFIYFNKNIINQSIQIHIT